MLSLLSERNLKIDGLNLLVFETYSCTTVHVTTFVHNILLLPRDPIKMPIFVFQTMVAVSKDRSDSPMTNEAFGVF
jgi:hypothetical protein